MTHNQISPVTTPEDVKQVESLAKQIWNQHYLPIIGQQQVDYMLENFQSSKVITEQINTEYLYFLIELEHEPVGYLALIPDKTNSKLMISKIYVLDEKRGHGLGLALFNFTVKHATSNDLKTIWLTVNKDNSASIAWYKKLGFKITEEVKADIGNGYFMDDYILEFIPNDNLEK